MSIEAIKKAASVDLLPETRSQQKLVGDITSIDRGLSIVKNGFAFTLTVNGAAGKTIGTKGIDIIWGSFADKGDMNEYTKNLQIGDGEIYRGAVGDPDEGCTIFAESQSEIDLRTFRQLMMSGAIRLTECIVRTSGEKADIQVTESFTLESVDFRGYDRDKLNNGVVKGQELSQENVLGPFRFPEDTVVGGVGQGLSYKLLGLSGALTRTVKIELYFDNYTTIPMLLKNLLLGDRASRNMQQ